MVMQLTENEQLELWGIRRGFENFDFNQVIGNVTQGLTDLLNSRDPQHLQRAIAGIEQAKLLCQRVHNYNHTLGMIAAKVFLESEFPDLPWSEVEFGEHANRSGSDLVVNRLRIVAELKTTEPAGKHNYRAKAARFGSNQLMNVEKDLRKLSDPKYRGFHKYMFVTSPLAYACLGRDFRLQYPEINFVLLSGTTQISRAADDLP